MDGEPWRLLRRPTTTRYRQTVLAANRRRRALAARPCTHRAARSRSVVVSSAEPVGSGIVTLGFANWRPMLYAYVALVGGDRRRRRCWARREPGCRALFVCRRSCSRVAVVIFPTLFGFYIASLDWNLSSVEGPHFNRPRAISSRCSTTPTTGTPCSTWSITCRGVGGVRDRVRPGAAPQRRDQGAQVLPRLLPSAVHAEPGGGELDDRQVADGIPLRPGGDPGARIWAGTRPPSSPIPGVRGLRSRPWMPGCGSRSW